MKLIDLHVHSNISDGTFSPSELAVYAKNKGLSAIALTDHDTVGGIEDCIQKGLEVGLEVIAGIEFSAEYLSKEVHILGYYIDYENQKLIDKLKYLVESRRQRNLKMLSNLNNLGFTITEEDLAADSSPDTIYTRAHFATALYRKGYVATRQEAFEKYIGHGHPGYVKRVRFAPKECIDTIHEAGGLAVLAHPNLYGFSSSEKEVMLNELTALGLDGMETLYSTHSKEEVVDLLKLCLKYKLFPTGGSDFHGDYKPGLDIGIGYGNLQVPYELTTAMQKKLNTSSL